MPPTIQGAAEARASVGLDVAVAPPVVVVVEGNDSVSPRPTALAALPVSVTVVPVAEATVPTILPVVSS